MLSAIANFDFPLKDAKGNPVEMPGWTCHNPMQTDGLVFESNNEGAYGRVYHVGFMSDDGSYVRDGMLRAERGGAVDMVIDQDGRFGLQLRQRPQTKKNRQDWLDDYNNGTVDWDAIGRNSWEVPRGYGDKIEKIAETAKREAEEETGFKVVSYEHMFWANDNTASVAHMTGVSRVELDINTSSDVTDPDHEKALTEVTYFDERGLLGLIESGELYCFMTLGAMTPTLLRRSMQQKEVIATLRTQLEEAGIEPAA